MYRNFIYILFIFTITTSGFFGQGSYDPDQEAESVVKAHTVFSNLRDNGIQYHRDPNIAFY
jgi:hypothetical protein